MTLRGNARPAPTASGTAPPVAPASAGTVLPGTVLPGTVPPGTAAPDGPGPRATTATRALRALVAVLPQWVAARVVVGGALGLAHVLVDHTHPSSPGVAARVHEGLLGWDAGWYEAIARVGYGALGHQSLRFFPLFPLVGRALAQLPGVSAGAALVVVANVSALVATALLRVLVRRETGDARLADRATWLLSLAPPAFVLVMGYAEAPLLVCSIGSFLAVRRAWPGAPAPRWWAAALLGLAAGLTRPLGVLLALGLAVEAVRRWPRAGTGERAMAVVATLSPVAGAGAFACWSWAAFGDALLPLRVQTSAGHHGGLSDPFRVLADDVRGAFHHHLGTALHVPWVALAVVLVVVCWRRLPASYGAFATGVLLAALSGTNLDSFERYALSAFPLVIAAATLTASRRVERFVLALAAAGLAGYALLAFTNVVVP
jgi:hypothetical protein